MREGKERLVAELLDKPFRHARLPTPLIRLRDLSGWTLAHWAAAGNHRDVSPRPPARAPPACARSVSWPTRVGRLLVRC